MRAGSAITHAINSAQYIIERLNVADSFAVVAFGTRVQQIYPEGGGMVKGNLENTANAAGALSDIQATREAVYKRLDTKSRTQGRGVVRRSTLRSVG